MEHSSIPPSSAHIWGKPDGCTGWAKMAALYPETEKSEAALEGDASHGVAADLIRAAGRGGLNTPTKANTVGTVAGNGVVISEDMFEGAEVYANDVILMAQEHGVYNIQVEKKLASPAFHPQAFGTPDSWFYAPKADILPVWDYKFGHLEVEAFQNWQTINYVAFIASVQPEITDKTKVHIRIVQPRIYRRSGPVREWVVTYGELKPLVATLRGNAHRAMGEGAELRTGKHCKYCQARWACEPARKCGLEYFEMVGQPVPVELPPEALAVQYTAIRRALEALTLLETGYAEQVNSLLRARQAVPGYRLEPTTGKETWTKPLPEVAAMGALMKTDLVKEAMVTPNQARKLGIPKDIVAQYSGRPKSGFRVAAADNRMQEVFSK